MQAERLAPAVQIVALAALVLAVTWDLAGMLLRTPAWWPVVSYAAAAIAVIAGCAALLLRMFARRSGEARPHGVARQLGAVGLVLGAWLLRGHPEIPPDPPLIAATLVAALLYALPLITRRRAPAADRR
jgi:uncharacterized membrane protein